MNIAGGMGQPSKNFNYENAALARCQGRCDAAQARPGMAVGEGGTMTVTPPAKFGVMV